MYHLLNGNANIRNYLGISSCVDRPKSALLPFPSILNDLSGPVRGPALETDLVRVGTGFQGNGLGTPTPILHSQGGIGQSQAVDGLTCVAKFWIEKRLRRSILFCGSATTSCLWPGILMASC